MQQWPSRQFCPSSADLAQSKPGTKMSCLELYSEAVTVPVLAQGEARTKFGCALSCLELYNEAVTDLLPPAAGGARSGSAPLQLREHPERGVHAEGLTQLDVLNGAQHQQTSVPSCMPACWRAMLCFLHWYGPAPLVVRAKYGDARSALKVRQVGCHTLSLVAYRLGVLTAPPPWRP